MVNNNIINQAEYNRDKYQLNLNMDIYPARKKKKEQIFFFVLINRNPRSSSDYPFQLNANQAMQMKMRSKEIPIHTLAFISGKARKSFSHARLFHRRTMHMIALSLVYTNPHQIESLTILCFSLALISLIIISMYFSLCSNPHSHTHTQNDTLLDSFVITYMKRKKERKKKKKRKEADYLTEDKQNRLLLLFFFQWYGRTQ